MEIWVWLLIGFLTGIVVAAIIGLLFRGGSSDDEEKTQNQVEVQLAKSEVKITVLEDKLQLAEADKVALEEKLVAEHQEQLNATQAEHRADLAIIESEKIALAASLAEIQGQLKLANEQLEQSTKNLENGDDSEDINSATGEDGDLQGDLPVIEDEEVLDQQPGPADSLQIQEDRHEVIELEESGDGSEGLIEEEVFEPLESGELEAVEKPMQEIYSADEEFELVSNFSDEIGSLEAAVIAEDLGVEDLENSMSSAENVAEPIEALEGSDLVREEDSTELREEVSEIVDDAVEIEDNPGYEDEVGAIVAASAAGVVLSGESSNSEEIPTAESGELIDPVIAEMQETNIDESNFMSEEVIEEDLPSDSPAPFLWPEDDSVWHGEYFNNMNLEGEPDLVREDDEVNFDWEFGSPDPEINIDKFSVRWTRKANLPPGLYRFTVTSDDGSRLWVNERLVISAWYDHKEMTFRREMELPGGPVNLRLEYYEKDMEALIRCSWERIG